MEFLPSMMSKVKKSILFSEATASENRLSFFNFTHHAGEITHCLYDKYINYTIASLKLSYNLWFIVQTMSDFVLFPCIMHGNNTLGSPGR